MESITKLQGKLREAEDILQYVSKELEHFAEDKTVGTELNFSKIKLRGEQYSFYEHPLKKQIFQDEYFALMIYIISLGDKKEEGWTLLYRIVAGCGYQKDLQNLTTDAMTLTEERLSEIIRMIYSAEMARTFALDSLMICCHMGADDAQLQFLSDLYELLKLDKNFLTEAVQFVKVFDSTFWDNLAEKSRAWKFLTARDLATYIGAYPAASLEEAAKLNYKRLVISAITYTSKDVLKLDNWKTNGILFLRCQFNNCGGIASDNKIVKFIDCAWEGNIVRFDNMAPNSYAGFYRWTDEKYSGYRAFLHFHNVTYVSCKFKNFKDDVPMIYMGNGIIHKCIFDNCRQDHCGSMLLNIRNTIVTKTQFLSSYSGVDDYSHGYHSFGFGGRNHSRNTSGFGCMIYAFNSKLVKNEFSQCHSHLHTAYSRSGFCCFLLLDNNSLCTNCKFNDIQVSGHIMDGSYYGRSAQTNTIGLLDSTEKNNEGEISTSTVSGIPKELFIVGDKQY